MKITKKEFLQKDTWVNKDSRTIITSDITWLEGVGEVHHGFNMKQNMDKAKFEEAMKWKNPGDYILEKYPADGTFLPNRLIRLSIDEAYDKVSQWGRAESFTYEEHSFDYQISLWRGYGYQMNTSLAFEAKDEEEALIKASLADPNADIEEADEARAQDEPLLDQAVYLDRSEYGASNIYLSIENARVEKLD